MTGLCTLPAAGVWCMGIGNHYHQICVTFISPAGNDRDQKIIILLIYFMREKRKWDSIWKRILLN